MANLDPDQFSSRFGRLVADDDYAGAIRELLIDDRWRALGEAAFAEINSRNSLEAATAQHLTAYEQLLQEPSN